MTEAFIYDALRSPCGKGNKNGALFEVKPVKLLSSCLKALKKRNQLDTHLVEDLVIGCVVPAGDQADNIAKTALLYSGWADNIAGIQLNRFQTSGLSAVGMAAAKIKAGWGALIVAGGLESTSRIQWENHRGAIFGDPDAVNRAAWVPSGMAADLVATKEGFSKKELDNYAFRSHQKALNAQKRDYFEKSIISIHDQNDILILDKDEWLNLEINLENLTNQSLIFSKAKNLGFEIAALKKYPLIERIAHVHSEGNTALPADGAALVLIGNEAQAKVLERKARARIIATAAVGSEPSIAHLGGIEAAQKVLKNARLKPKDIDLWAVNEAYAAPALYFQKTFKILNKQLNPCGGNIALGDPLGATGAVLLGILLDELERQGLKRGLVAMSAEAGLGASIIIETCE